MVVTLVAKGMAIPLGIASSVITARYLGPEGRGVLALLIVLQGVAVLLGNIGLSSASTYFVARRKEQSLAIASNVFTATLALGLSVAAAFYFIGTINPSILIGQVDVGYLHLFLLTIPFTFFAQILQGIFLAYQKIYEFNLLELVPRLLQVLAFTIVLIFLGGGTNEAVWCFVGAAIVGGVVYVTRLQTFLPLKLQLDLPLLREMTGYGLKNYTSSLLLFLVARVNLMFINQQLGTSEAGIYSIAMQIMDVAYLLPSTLALLLFSKVSGNAEDTGALTTKVLRFSTFAMVFLCAGILLFGRPAVELMFGDAFSGSVLPLYWLTPGLVSIALATIILNDLAGRGLPVVVPIASAVALSVNLVVVIPTIESYGLVAPAIATSLAHVILLAIVTRYFAKRINVRIRELFLLKFSDLTSLTFSRQ